MKHPVHQLVVSLILTAQVATAVEEPSITAFSVSEGHVNLQWEGGAPPFDIESSADLASWTREMQTMDSSASAPAPVGDAAAFFRIRAEQPMPGEHIGQLRIDEGEFGKPLARHRLKSLWDFHLPETGLPSSIPEEFFQQLSLRLIYRDGDALSVFTGTLGDLPDAVVTAATRKITVSWTFGQGDAQRDYVLEMAFRYDIAPPRGTIHLSDPQYTLTCTYAVPQPEAGHDNDYNLIMVETGEDTASLYQIADEELPAWLAWLQRDAEFQADDVRFAIQYTLGVPMREGSPNLIWKTPVLDEWGSTTVTGLTTEPLVITDRFSQTYKPGHHNFVEDFWIEPVLIPGLAAETLRELRDANIRFIVASHPRAFPESPSTMRLVGFDLTVR